MVIQRLNMDLVMHLKQLLDRSFMSPVKKDTICLEMPFWHVSQMKPGQIIPHARSKVNIIWVFLYCFIWAIQYLDWIRFGFKSKLNYKGTMATFSFFDRERPHEALWAICYSIVGISCISSLCHYRQVICL